MSHRTDAPAFNWTDEKIAEMKRLWQQGLSASQVAKAIGHPSKNAVIGKLHRLKLQGEGRYAPSVPRIVKPKLSGAQRRKLKGEAKPRAQSKVFGPTKVKPFIIAGNGAVIASSEAKPARLNVKADAFAPLPGSEPVPWTERAFQQCAWPVDVPNAGTQHSCGLTCDEGQTYCSTHLWWRKDKSKPKASASELIRSVRRVAA